MKISFADLLAQPVPAPPAPHRVTVETVHVIDMSSGEGFDETRHDIKHTPQCDALSYGEECWLDQQWRDNGTADWPTEPGAYIATGREVRYEHTGEYNFFVDFEPVSEPKP